MATSLPQANPAIFYPSSDGEPLAESYDHLYAIITILEVLRVYLIGQQATVLANQFLYYEAGRPNKHVAPDVMVIFNVEPGGRDSYKLWEEGEVPRVVFEITSPSTRQQDEKYKKSLYQQLGVQEYWQFDPRNEWIPGQLKGYHLPAVGPYEPIEDNCSWALNLRLVVEDKLLVFYRLDNGERLLPPGELTEALQGEKANRQEAELVADRAEQRAVLEKQRADRAEQEKTIADRRADQAEQEKTIADRRADQADRRADQAEQQAALLRQKLRDLGIDPNIET
jgi:Uma2 family endonuclease